MKRVRSLRKNLLKMIFGEKFNEITNESESSQFTDKNNGLTQPHDPSLPFSAIYFLRNRLFQPSQSFDLSLNSPLPPLDMIFPGKKLSSQENLHIKSSLQLNSILSKRPRGEKRPIPENQKDEKYFERRKRNNEAAKKSRDARKMREDRIALRATLLEQENSLLRAQTIALREEVYTLRQILCNPRSTSSVTQN